MDAGYVSPTAARTLRGFEAIGAQGVRRLRGMPGGRGRQYVFGIPGEETLDLNESLDDPRSRSSLFATSRAGPTWRTCTAASPAAPASASARSAPARRTSSPRSPTPTSTARRSSRSPVRATSSGCTRSPTSTSTSCRSCSRSRSGTRALNAPEIIPEVVRKAFKVAETEKPGATHLELPEDVMAEQLDAEPLPRRKPSAAPSPAPASCCGPPTSSARAINPVVLAGNGVVRAAPRRRCASSPAPPASRSPRRSWARACSTTRTRARSAPSACSRATTRWRASRTPTS